MKHQLDRAHPIPDTSIFDGRLSRRGYRLNKLCGTLCTPENRAAFKADEEAYIAKFGLTEEERTLVRKRDFGGLIEAGLNIYFMLKLGSVTGNGLYRMGAQMRGAVSEKARRVHRHYYAPMTTGMRLITFEDAR